MRPPSRSSNVVDHLQPADLGLLAAAAPELAGCIAALRSLGDLTFPLRSRGELCAALFRDAHGDDAIFAGHGLRFTRAELEAVLPDELFPMETLHDLALRAFTGVAAAHARHRADAAHVWASAASTLLTAGYTAESVTAALTASDLTLLQHTGMLSVQLQPPGSAPAAPGGPDGQ